MQAMGETKNGDHLEIQWTTVELWMVLAHCGSPWFAMVVCEHRQRRLSSGEGNEKEREQEGKEVVGAPVLILLRLAT